MCRKEKVSKTNIRINQLTNARIEHELIEKELNEILNGIPDVVKVYNPDYTVSFFNDAGYKFYNVNAEDIKGKKCYEILGRKEKCIDCSCEEAVKNKKMIYKERYVQELNKFMDVCYNPILDENGEIIYIVERLSDITEKKVLQKMLEEREERYKAAINSIPDPVVVILDNVIVLANREACNLVDLEYDKFIGTNIFKHFPKKYIRALHKRYKRILAYKKMKDIVEYDFNLPNNKTANLQISHSYILYDGKPAIIAVIRDITEIRNELNKAAELQRKTLQNDFPAKEFIDINLLYVPANIISGDFYRIYKINDELIIGMITDVRGKGISAALSISAFDVLCFQELESTHEPIEIINNLNKKLVDYYEENYIAACCFSMDFNKKELKAVGAGINQFIFQRESVQEKIVEGAFLGMFKNSEFSEQVISFQKGDKFFFFTDGLEFILDEDRIIQTYMEDVNTLQFKNYLDAFLNDTILEKGKLKDDCTMLAIEIL